MDESDEEIEFCKEELAASLERLAKLDGVRTLRGVPGGEMRDVTDETREREEKMIAYWRERLSLLGVSDA